MTFDRIIGILGLVVGIIFGGLGIYLFIQADKKNDEATKILIDAERWSLFVTFQSIVSNLPTGGNDAFNALTEDKKRDIFRATYSMLVSQGANKSLLSNHNCDFALSDFRDYIFLMMLMDEWDNTVVKDYYNKLFEFSDKCVYR